LLVAAGYKVGGIFYGAAVACFIGALFLVFLKLARPVMEADAPGSANGAPDPGRPGPKAASVA
jgi:hypothetical protein